MRVMGFRVKAGAVNLKACLAEQTGERRGSEMIAVARRVEREPIAAKPARLIAGSVRHLHNQGAAAFQYTPCFDEVMARLIRVFERRPEGHYIEVCIFASRVEQGAVEDAPGTDDALGGSGGGFAGLDAERVPGLGGEGAQEEARAAANIENAPAVQFAGRKESRLFRLRFAYPVERRLAAPVIGGIEKGEFIVAHLRQGAQDAAAIAARDHEKTRGVA